MDFLEQLCADFGQDGRMKLLISKISLLDEDDQQVCLLGINEDNKSGTLPTTMVVDDKRILYPFFVYEVAQIAKAELEQLRAELG